MEPVKAKDLFKFFVNEGYDLGTEQNFFSALQNEEQRLKLFKFFTEDEGYNLGDYKNFTLKKKESSEPIVDQQAKQEGKVMKVLWLLKIVLWLLRVMRVI